VPAVSKAPKVTACRAELIDLQPRYDKVRDCVAGEETIKKAGTKYLPKPNESDLSTANETRYKNYLTRAVFYNVTGRTLDGLLGTVFQKTPHVEIPSSLEILKQDADGGGVTLEQQAKKALSSVLQFGRAGLLVDYPATSEAVTVADQQSGQIRPNITLWEPWDVINWRVATIGGQRKLSLVVISEQLVTDDDGFEADEVEQIRVLRLVNGVYVVELWQQDVDADGKPWLVVASYIPTDAAGKPWNFIPFVFIGSKNNDPTPDLPPLYDLACLNVAHYRNSADYEEACYMLGQPTPVVSGLTKDWVDDVLKGTIMFGSRAIVPLPAGGQAQLLQIAPNTMPKEAMEHKEAQMLALGAKLVEQRGSGNPVTATQVNQNEASETSILATAANNVSSAYSSALKWAGIFGGAAGECVYKLNTEFQLRLASFQDRAQLVSEWQANAITTSEMRQNLNRIGVATLPLEDYQDEIDTAGPDLGMPVNAQKIAATEAAANAKKAANTGTPADKKGV
jgi:hypothetical protein